MREMETETQAQRKRCRDRWTDGQTDTAKDTVKEERERRGGEAKGVKRETQKGDRRQIQKTRPARREGGWGGGSRGPGPPPPRSGPVRPVASAEPWLMV